MKEVNLTPFIPLSLERRGGGEFREGRSPSHQNSPFPYQGKGVRGMGYKVA